MSIFQLMDEGRNEEALEWVLQSIQKLNKESEGYLNWLNALGYIYCNLENYNKANEVYDEYIEISKNNSSFKNLHIGFHQKAMVLRLNQQYTEALDYIIKEKEIIIKYFKDDQLKLSVNEYEYGYLSYLMNNNHDAFLHMEQGLNYALKTDDFIAQACAYRGLAEICSKENIQQANDYFDKAYELFLKADDQIGADEINQIRNKVI